MLEAAAFFAFGLFALTYIWWRSISGYRLETAAVNQFDDVSHHENDESAQEECVRVNEVLPTSESGKVSSPLILKIYYGMGHVEHSCLHSTHPLIVGIADVVHALHLILIV